MHTNYTERQPNMSFPSNFVVPKLYITKCALFCKKLACIFFIYVYASYQFLTITLNYKSLSIAFLSQYLSWWTFRIYFFFFSFEKKCLSNFTLSCPLVSVFCPSVISYCIICCSAAKYQLV